VWWQRQQLLRRCCYKVWELGAEEQLLTWQCRAGCGRAAAAAAAGGAVVEGVQEEEEG
jgi:hypothetical protein